MSPQQINTQMRKSTPWGYKITSHLYFEGVLTEDELNRVVDAINEATPSAVFHGMDVKDIAERPYSQGEDLR